LCSNSTWRKIGWILVVGRVSFFLSFLKQTTWVKIFSHTADIVKDVGGETFILVDDSVSLKLV